jgi:hypothetical protein
MGKPPFKASDGGQFDILREGEDVTERELYQGSGAQVLYAIKVRPDAFPNGSPMSVLEKLCNVEVNSFIQRRLTMEKTMKGLLMIVLFLILANGDVWAAMPGPERSTREGFAGNLMAASQKTDPTGQEPVYEVVSPARGSSIKVKPLAPSLNTLEGKTLCELWNYVFLGDVTFPKIEELLSKRYPGVKFVRYEEFGTTHGPDEEKELAMIKALPENLKKYKCDAVISGNGG